MKSSALQELAERCVRHIEFVGEALDPSFGRDLRALREGWPEHEWRPALVEAAATVDAMCIDVWQPLRDEIAPHASAGQLVGIAARHSQMSVADGMDLFGFERAVELLLGAGRDAIPHLTDLADGLDGQEELNLSALAIATLGYAALCDALGEAYPEGYIYLWGNLIDNASDEHLAALGRVLMVLPFGELGGILPLAGIREVEHPETGEVVAYSIDGKVVHVTTRSPATPDTSEVEIFAAKSAKKAQEAVAEWVCEKIRSEGYLPLGAVKRPRPLVAAPWSRATVRCVAWRPDGGEVYICADDRLRRYGADLEPLAEIEGIAPESLAFSPDGQRLAAWEDMRLMILDAATGEVLVRRPLEGYTIDLAWSPDSQLLHVHSHQRRLVTIDARTGETLAATALASSTDALAVTPAGTLLVADAGNCPTLLEPRDHAIIGRGERIGGTAAGTIAGAPPAVLWAPHCETIFWRETTSDGRGFAPTLTHLRLTARTDAGEEILFCDYRGCSADGRHVYLLGRDSYGTECHLAIVDRALGRLVHCTRLAVGDRFFTGKAAALSPDRRWLLLWGGSDLLRWDLRALEFEPSGGKLFLERDVIVHPAHASFEGGYQRRTPPALTPEQVAELRAWAEGSGLSPAAPASWTRVEGGPAEPARADGGPPTLAARVSGADTERALLQLLASLGPEEYGPFFAIIDAIQRRREDLAVRACRAVTAIEAERAASALAAIGDDVIVPFVSTDEWSERADMDLPFEPGWALAAAYETDELDPEYHCGGNLDRVLRWSGFGGVEGLRQRFLAQAARLRDDALEAPLFPPGLDLDWCFDPHRVHMLEGRRLKIFDVVELLEKIEALTDADFEEAARQPSSRDAIIRAYAPELDLPLGALDGRAGRAARKKATAKAAAEEKAAKKAAAKEPAAKEAAKEAKEPGAKKAAKKAAVKEPAAKKKAAKKGSAKET